MSVISYTRSGFIWRVLMYGGIITVLLAGSFCLATRTSERRQALRNRIGHLLRLDTLIQQALTVRMAEERRISDAAIKTLSTQLDEERKVREADRLIMETRFKLLQPFLILDAFMGRTPVDDGLLSSFMVLEASIFTDPSLADYPDGLHVVRARMSRPAAGASQPAGNIRLYVPAFLNRKAVFDAPLAPGDQLTGWCLTGDEIPNAIREIGVFDSLEETGGELRYLIQPRRIPGGPVIQHEETRPPVLSRDQLQAITRTRIQDELTKRGGNWEAWVASLQDTQEHLGRLIQTTHVWHAWIQNNSMPRGNRTPLRLEAAGFGGKQLSSIEQMQQFARMFESRGITFIYVPIPLKAQAWPELFLEPDDIPTDDIVVPQWRKYVLDLMEAGVETVDLLPAFREHVHRGSKRPLYFSDHHWAPAAIEIAAKETAKHLARIRPDTVSSPRTIVRIPGTMPELREVDGFSVWSQADGILSDSTEDPNANILIFGDSNNEVALNTPVTPEYAQYAWITYMGAGNGSFTAQLAFELQTPLARGTRWNPFINGSLLPIPAGTFAGKTTVVFVSMMTYSQVSGNWAQETIPEAAFQPR